MPVPDIPQAFSKGVVALAVTLVDLEGWSVDEAAQILECPSGTVKSRCHRGRARLHTLLRNQPDEPGVPPPGGDQA